jgi:hypothetical protein
VSEPASLTVEPLLGNVILSLIEFNDDGLTTTRLRFTPAAAARLAQVLITAAESAGDAMTTRQERREAREKRHEMARRYPPASGAASRWSRVRSMGSDGPVITCAAWPAGGIAGRDRAYPNPKLPMPQQD